MAFSFNDQTISAYQTKHISQKMEMKSMDFKTKGDILTDIKLIGSDYNCRLVTIDYAGKLTIFCLKDCTMLVEHEPVNV